MTTKISVKDFTGPLVGRGVWHYLHSVGYAADTRQDVISLYHTIFIYDKKIRCDECKEHSNKYIIDTYDYIVAVLKDLTLTDSEVINIFNDWLYEYHYQANVFSGKDPSTFPTRQEVTEFYLSDETCNSSCAK